ncbi:rapid alkalinization factor-like [Phoenix dactylifera]|uniref:Rapid alkalinization factor-like n=1 Tax=Phoenix dactylifera TaxID=42345 RepID=A0A8B7MUG4_PHODC|nr:rapid alkalinization factor-like [Phoenix dactylifera]
MAPRRGFPLLLLLLLLLLAVACTTNSSALNTVGSEAVADFLAARGDGRCDGLLGQCIDEDTEMETETGISRRGLARAGVRHISYGALSKNRVPCNRRGRSYYNCSRGKSANPYRRGCSVITQCQRIFN